MSNEPKRPYYDPSILRQKREVEAKYTPPPKKQAVVIPVADWTIANALFWWHDKRGKVKPPNV